VRLRASYARVEDFLRDHEEQISRGGLLVRCEPPSGLDRGATVELEIATPVGQALLLCEVIQVLAGAGVAVTVAADQLSSLVEAASRESSSRAARDSVPPSAHGPALAKKIQQALHGDKTQRTALLREQNKMIHGYVVRNAQIQLDEVVAIARMTTVSVDVLTYIAARREWAERPEVAIALVRNPKTPVPLAIRLLDRVAPAELRQLAKTTTVREAILRAARKKVVG
jgi:hypothetical protein